jgi:hypothetical protein
MLLCLRDMVVSDGEKADVIRQVSDGKMSGSESPLTHRKGFQSLSKRVEVADARNSVDVTCLRSTWQPVFRRHEPITGRADSKCQLGPGLGCRIAIASSAVMSCITACMPARID